VSDTRHAALGIIWDGWRGEAVVPPQEVNEGANAQLEDIFGNDGADLGTRQISDTEAALHGGGVECTYGE
jgi:hypothetical protein